MTIQTTQAPTITGDIDLRGNGTGSGGRFNILNTNGLFQIGSGASTGINGNILLSGGGNGGSGGWLSVQKGNGTMEILDTTAVDVSGTGNGGRIDYMGDTLKLPAGTFSVNGNGAAGNGGYFFAQLRNLITPAAGNLTISANGSGTGNGGGIDINILSANPLTLGPNVFLSATGGSAGSASGDGGLIRVVSGITGISLIGDNITTQPLGANGKGGYLIFTGYPLSITGSLSANGVGSGAGGRIQIYSGSTFTVGALGVSGNGVTGDISAFSSGTGPGGTVDISAPTITVLSSINVGKTGTIFTNGGLNSVFQGTGQVTGNLYLYGFNTTLNLSTPVTVLGIIATGGTATINVPSLTVIPAGSIQGNNITIDSPVVHNNGNIRSNSSSTIQIRSASDLLVDGFGTIFGNVNFVSNTGNISVTQGNIYGTITHLAPGNFSLTIGQTLSTSGVLTSTFFDGNTVRTISSVAFVDTRLPNAPSSSIAATDTTRFTLSLRKEGSDKMDGNVKYVLSMRTDLVMLTRANQIFGIAGGDDSYAEGEEGTIVSEENDVTVIHCGKVVIDTGDKAVNIKTPEGTLSINPNSTVLVERSRTSRTRVVSLGGTGGTMNLKADNSAVNLSLGQELIASETELPDEELIPADGIPRESALEGAIHKEKTRRIVSNLKVKHVLERDVMIAGCLVHVGGSHANKASTARLQPRLASHLQAAAFTQGDTLDAARLRSVAGVSKVGESLPARIHVEKDTDLQRKDGAIELNQGSVVFCTKDGQTIKTPNVTLQAKSNTAMQVERRSSATIVRVCSGVNTVKAVVGKKHLFLSAGDELIVCTTDVRHEKDGIGRREFRHLRTEGASIRLAEFSLIGVLGTGAFNSVAHGSNDSDKFALNQILKSAASLQMVRRSRTPFES